MEEKREKEVNIVFINPLLETVIDHLDMAIAEAGEVGYYTSRMRGIKRQTEALIRSIENAAKDE